MLEFQSTTEVQSEINGPECNVRLAHVIVCAFYSHVEQRGYRYGMIRKLDLIRIEGWFFSFSSSKYR